MDEDVQKRDWSAYQPERVLPKLWWRIGATSRLTFLATLAFALVTHLYMFVNKLPNGDDLECLYRDFAMTTSGRWFDQAATALGSWYSIPWVTGVVALLFLALSAALLASVFALRQKTSAVMLAALMATFPVLAAQFSYMFYADLYMIAMCLSVGAIWLAKRSWWLAVPAAAAIACAMGAYQAYIGVAVVVCMLSLMLEILRGEPLKDVLQISARYLLCGVLGIALYFGILHGALAYTGQVLTDYQGINDMGSLPDIRAVLPKMYHDFGAYFFEGTYFDVSVLGKVMYAVVLAVGALALVYAIIKRSVWKKPTIVILLLLALTLPIGYQLIELMAPLAEVHCLMLPQYTLFLVMPVIFFDCAFDGAAPGFWAVGGKWLLVAASLLIAYQFYLTCNLCYLHLELRYEITYATEVRILDRLEQLEGYAKDTPVAVIGAFPNENMSLYPQDSYEAVQGLTGIRGNLVHHDKNYRGFYQYYLGTTLNVLTEEESAPYAAAAAKLPIWPANGSVSIVDGVAIVHIR